MALACDPRLIVADEPTTALDVMVQAQVLGVLQELVSELDVGLLMISHDLSVLADLCDRIAVMYAGRVVEHGPAGKVFTDAAAPVHRRALGVVPAHRRPGGAVRAGRAPRRPARPGRPAVGLLVPPALPASASTSATASSPSCAPTAATASAACLLVEAPMSDTRARGPRPERPFQGRGRPRRPRRRRRRPDVSAAGEIVALVGESGSGKTTLARALLGLERPAAGEVLLDGAPLDRSARGLRAFRRRVQLVLQDPAGALNPRHTVYESVAEGIRLHRLDSARPEGRTGDRAGGERAVLGRAATAGAAVPALPARAVGRPAAARADRRRAGDGARADRGRRARLVAGRLDPRRDPGAAARPARATSASASSWSPTTSAWRGTSPTGSP